MQIHYEDTLFTTQKAVVRNDRVRREDRGVDYSALSRNVDRASARKHFAAGAEWMRNELTRWRDPKEQLPADGQEVLAVVNRQYNTYSILQHDTYGWWQYVPLNGGGWCGYDGDIIGWRPINV